MKFTSLSLALGALLSTGLLAQAQTRPATKTSIYTTVDPYGNVTRTTMQAPRFPPSNPAAAIAQQGVYGPVGSTTVTSGYSNGYAGYSRPYSPPANCAPPVNNYPGYSYYPYPYPYGGQVNNNYYYPALPTTGVIIPPALPHDRPATYTNIPIGTQYNYGYGVPAYPYGYGYGGPAVPYSYGGTTIYGAGSGSITTQSQSSGAGISVGRGGVRGNFGVNNSSTTTTVQTYYR